MSVEHFDLSGKQAVVVGNTSAVVEALVQGYREAGADVTTVFCAASELPDALPGQADVIASAFDHFLAKPLTELTDEDVGEVMRANLASAIAVARHGARVLPAGGRLVYVTHVLGERGLPNTSVYSAAHGGVHNLIRAVAQELAPRGISVNGIALGWMDWMRDRIDKTDEEAARAIRFTIAKREGTAEDVAPMAVWLSGGGAGFVTGQIFPLDGGLTQHL